MASARPGRRRWRPVLRPWSPAEPPAARSTCRSRSWGRVGVRRSSASWSATAGSVSDMAERVMREVTLALPMVPEMEIEASKTATAIAESIRMSPDRIDEVRMAVVEACINALEHSHASDREVYVTFQVLGEGGDPDKLRIMVGDTGIGFAPAGLEEPTIEDKLQAVRKRGWGLKIIRGLMDEVEILSGADGTTVVMSKMR